MILKLFSQSYNKKFLGSGFFLQYNVEHVPFYVSFWQDTLVGMIHELNTDVS